MLDGYIDPYRLFLAVSDLVLSIYAVVLWWFGMRRTGGLLFFRILVATNIVFLLMHIAHVVIVCTEDTLKFDIFGIHAYANLAHTLYVIGPLTYTASLLAFTMMVRWIIREREKNASVSKT